MNLQTANRQNSKRRCAQASRRLTCVLSFTRADTYRIQHLLQKSRRFRKRRQRVGCKFKCRETVGKEGLHAERERFLLAPRARDTANVLQSNASAAMFTRLTIHSLSNSRQPGQILQHCGIALQSSKL